MVSNLSLRRKAMNRCKVMLNFSLCFSERIGPVDFLLTASDVYLLHYTRTERNILTAVAVCVCVCLDMTDLRAKFSCSKVNAFTHSSMKSAIAQLIMDSLLAMATPLLSYFQ